MPDTPISLQVFVSHSWQDKAICDQVVIALRGAGADVWYDEHNLGAGVLRREIMKELAQRPVVLVMLSKAAFASEWVQDECEWAYNLYKRKPERLILPVIVGAFDRDDFDSFLYLESLTRIEAPGNRPYPVEELIARTLTLLALTPAGQQPVAVVPQTAESLNDLLTQGKALQAQKKHTEALPFFQRATQLDPNSFSAWFNLGYTLYELERYAEALPAYEHASRLDPNNSDAWGNMSGVLNHLTRYEEGLATSARATTLDPSNATAWTYQGDALNQLMRYEEALTAYDQALSLEPTLVGAWTNKGVALNKLQRYEEAIAAYDQALAHGETVVRWKNKAVSLRKLGRMAEAEEAEQRAEELGG
jgi:tetratricopeptide (TPR) repeat protein